MVRKTTTQPGTQEAAASSAKDNAGAAETPPPARRTRRKAGATDTTKAEARGAGGPSFADSQRRLPEAPAAEQQRPSPEAASATEASGFDIHTASRAAGEAYGAVRDTLRKGADAVTELASDEGVKAAADKARGVAGRNKGAVAAGVVLLVGGAPVVAAATIAAVARGAKHYADGKDPLAAGREVFGEINGLADRAVELGSQAPALAGQAAELAGQARQALSGFAARWGFGKKSADADKKD